MVEAARTVSTDVDRVSFSGAIRIIRCRLPELTHSPPSTWHNQLIAEVAREIIELPRNRTNPQRTPYDGLEVRRTPCDGLEVRRTPCDGLEVRRTPCDGLEVRRTMSDPHHCFRLVRTGAIINPGRFYLRKCAKIAR